MPISTAVIPSYSLKGSMGRQIANLKGMDRGWFYPTFIIDFINNPASLLMYDKFFYDLEAVNYAKRFILYKANANITDDKLLTEMLNSENPEIDKLISGIDDGLKRDIIKKINLITELFNSPLFAAVDFEQHLNQSDVNQITNGFNEDINSTIFSGMVDELIIRYGPDYARPTPHLFEAMNMNVMNILLKKFDSGLIDDCVRAPLYHYKLLQSVPGNQTADSYLRLLPQILGLPAIQIRSVEEFLNYHQDKHLADFRNHIISVSGSNLSPEKIISELKEADKKLISAKKPESLSIVGSVARVLGSAGLVGLTAASGNPIAFSIASINFASSVIATRDMLNSYWEYSDLNWFRFLRGLSE